MDVRCDGAIVFWSLSTYTDREKLNDSIQPLGYGQIGQRSQLSVLEDAVGQVHNGPRLLVQPLDKRKAEGWCVVHERRDARINDYDVLASYWFERDLDGSTILTGQGTDFHLVTVADAFKSLRNTLRADQMRPFLLDVLKQRLGGVCINPMGHTYWLPESAIARWEEVKAAVKEASIGGASEFYTVRHSFDVESVAAVRDGVKREAEAEAKKIADGVLSGTLGQRALDSKVEAARAMTAKVEAYEKLLGETMTGLKESLKEARESAAIAAMLASVKSADAAV